MMGLVPGTSTFPYYTGTGFQSDDQLGGAQAHVTAMLRKQGITGPLMFVNASPDDDWPGEALVSSCWCPWPHFS